MSGFRFVAVILIGATLAGCASDGPRQDAGAFNGALLGAGLGALFGGRGAGNRVAGALVGGVVGGLVGSAIGRDLDERDRQRAYAAEMQALETGPAGAPVGWRSERTTYYGTIVPGPFYDYSGRRCRQYTHTIYINGQPQSARGTACRNPDGSWSAVG